MRGTINTLLNLSQIESGWISLDRTNVDLSSVANQIVSDVRLGTDKHQFELEIDEDARTVQADRAKLVEVMQNLIDNAVKYSPDGGTVTIKAVAADGGLVEVSVQDRGVGIARDDLDALFSPYERASAQARGLAGGTGLGLYIVKSLVELHGGRVWAESEVGSGSTFSLTLPRADGTGAADDGGVSVLEPRLQRPSEATAEPVPAEMRVSTDSADTA